MPNSTLGWTRLEIINKILDTLGRSTDAIVLARLKEDINFAQLAFWKMFDWKWGKMFGGSQNGLYTPIVDQQSQYETTTVTINLPPIFTYTFRPQDIDKVYISYNPTNPSDTTYLKYTTTLIKVESRELRIASPGFNQCGVPTHYAINDNKTIEIFPVPNTTLGTPSDLIGQYLWFDAKRMPTFMVNDTDYPDIPIEYQETFMQYFLCRSLSRERDPRMDQELLIFKDMLKQDKQTDLAEVESNLRIKFAEEELIPSTQNNLTWNLWNNNNF